MMNSEFAPKILASYSMYLIDEFEKEEGEVEEETEKEAGSTAWILLKQSM